MLSRITALLATAAFVLSASPRSAPAAEAAPIVVKSCDADGGRQTMNVTFTNTSQKVVTNVRFGIITRSDVLDFKDDAGTFAPGDVVHHRLREYFNILARVSCDVAQVTFQDGVIWENPLLLPDMVRAIPQTAGSNVALSRCYSAAGVRINFTNAAQQVATEVDLGLVQHGLLVWKDEDRGTFTPGTLIERGWDPNYPPPKNQTITGNAVFTDTLQEKCIVLGVNYADGTSWKNSNVPPESFKGPMLDAPTPGANDPVTVTGCDGSSAQGGGNGDWRADYTNASQKPIVAADFALFMNGKLEWIARDLHNLAPGDATTGKFLHIDPSFYHGVCVPVSVDFADGTSWLNPAFVTPKN